MRQTRLSLKHLAARGLLALGFLFAQNTAALHWLSHAVDATQAKVSKASASTERCDECLALGALGAAVSGGATSLDFAAGEHALLVASPDTPAPTALRLAFRSRAPPVLI